MSINFGDRVAVVDKNKNGECVKGTIVDIWRFSNKEITDYLVQLDSGPYVNVKPHYSNWFKLEFYGLRTTVLNYVSHDLAVYLR